MSELPERSGPERARWMVAPVERREGSLLDVANTLLRRWRPKAYGALIGGALLLGISLLIHPTYEAKTAFIQAESSRLSGLSSSSLGALAMRFGMIPGGLGSQVSLDFLQQAIKSRDVLDSVLLRPLAYDSSPAWVPGAPPPADTIDMMKFLKVRGNTPAKKLDRARRKVINNLNVSTDTRSGIVSLTFKTKDQYVGAAFLRRLVEVLNNFNLHTRQTTSHANRVFLEGRVQAAKGQLDSAEAVLRRFYEQNRRLQDAPSLIFEEGRLKRQVELAQQIYVTLSEDLEQARVDEVKDTPVITVVTTAQPPVRIAFPKYLLMVLAGMFVGFLAVVGWSALGDYVRRESHARSPAWNEFQENLATLPGGPSLARRLAKPALER